MINRVIFNYMTIQKKVVIAILIIGFLALSVGLLVTYHQVRNILIDTNGKDFAELARKTAERIDGVMKNEITLFQYLSANEAIIKGLKENRKEVIIPYLTYYLSFEEERERHLGLLVVNARGETIAHGNFRSVYPSDQSGELWWSRTYAQGKGKIYVSPVYLDKLTGRRTLDIGIPVLDPATERVIGGIRDIVNADVFFGFIKEINFGRTGHGMLVDSGGTPLVCPILPLVEHSINQPLIKLITGGGSGWTVAENDAHGGKNSIIGFHSLEYMNSLGSESLGGNKWYAFMRQDPEETFAPLRRLIKNLLFIYSAVVLMISVGGVLLARRLFLNPLHILHKGVEQIAKGDLDYKIDMHTGDELEVLALGFNRMGDALKEFYENLEGKVKERTRDLKKTMDYLGSILRYSSDMIITTDLSGRIVTFNEGAERILSYKKEEVIGAFMVDYYLDKEDRERLQKTIESGEMVTNYETQLVRKDGKIIDISLSLSLLRDERGKVIGTVGISKDITELKKAQRELKEYSQHLESMVEKRTLELEESKSHLEAMLGGIADGVLFADQDNRITFINDAAAQIFDMKREEWIGRDFKDCHSAEAHEKTLQLIREMREGRIKSYASEIKSGEKYIHTHFSPIMHGPEYLGIIFIARDITEMKMLQKELEDSEARYKDLVEQSPLMIHSVNTDRYFLDVNKTELAILGYTIEEMRGKRIEDITPEEFKEDVKGHIERVIREGRSRVEAQFIAKDGRRIDIEISATGLYDSVTGEFVRTRAFVRDITEIKRLQSELVNSEKLALIGKMSSTIAHELRNPLVPIGGFARLLYKKLEQEATLRKYTDVIIKEIDRMEILLHDILYFTKEIKPEFQSANLNEIINDLLYFYNETFTDKNIELHVHLSPDISLIPLDRSKIRQALINIFSNAVDAMPDGGRLTVESIEKEKEDKHYIVVTIKDSGPGIPEDIKKKIFEPFYTTKIHGLGLGLTLTKNVVESHGGEIEVESAEGRGTTFIISLPVSMQ